MLEDGFLKIKRTKNQPTNYQGHINPIQIPTKKYLRKVVTVYEKSVFKFVFD